MITDLINDYFEFCEEIIKKSFICILEEKTNTLTEKIYNEQINFNITNKNTIDMKSKSIIQEEIKPKIEKILKNKAHIYYLKMLSTYFYNFYKD